MYELEQACISDAAYIYETCRDYLNKKHKSDKYADENPDILAALIKSATSIFIHKPR